MSETQGVITDGWPYVITAYSITVAVLTAYGYSLFHRLKKAQEDN